MRVFRADDSGDAPPDGPLAVQLPRPAKRRLDDAQRQLAEDYFPLARSIAKPYKDRFPKLWEEIDSEASIALVESARTFDPARSTFATHARIRVRFALRDLIEGIDVDEAGEGPRLLKIHQADDAGDEGPRLVSMPHQVEDVADDRRDELLVDQADTMMNLVESLPEDQRAVCLRIYLGGESTTEIAGQLGCSQSKVSKLHTAALKAMKSGEMKKPERYRLSG